MKKILCLLTACVAVFVLNSCGSKAQELEVSFSYTRQAGPGSNQYAVWIENAQGEVVRTLFVTAFTSKGRSRNGQPAQRGYTFRPSCVPTWVSHVRAESLSDAQMDAFSGATPGESGPQTFTWDFKDQNGQAVPAGQYKLFVEATLLNDTVATWSGAFSTGDKPGAVTLQQVVNIPLESSHKDMVTDVKATLK